jgi:glycosyltransferase involved in cell wall biosynthesis
MALNSIPLKVLSHVGKAGVAAAWNRGLDELARLGGTDHVALIDDDDEWDNDHLFTCETAARKMTPSAQVVISGLRIVRDGREIPREPLTALRAEDFLAGNPGWQGSNTFIALDLLRSIGGFTTGLRSANDRDLAIRVLDQPGVRIAYTHRMTATWHLGSQADSISRYGSEDKRHGLSQFHRMYSHRMTPQIRQQAVRRAVELFGIDPESSP